MMIFIMVKVLLTQLVSALRRVVDVVMQEKLIVDKCYRYACRETKH